VSLPTFVALLQRLLRLFPLLIFSFSFAAVTGSDELHATHMSHGAQHTQSLPQHTKNESDEGWIIANEEDGQEKEERKTPKTNLVTRGHIGNKSASHCL